MEAVFDDSEGDTEVKTVSYNVDACIGDTKFRFAQYLRFSPASYAHYVDAYEHNLLYHRWTGNLYKKRYTGENTCSCVSIRQTLIFQIDESF